MSKKDVAATATAADPASALPAGALRYFYLELVAIREQLAAINATLREWIPAVIVDAAIKATPPRDDAAKPGKRLTLEDLQKAMVRLADAKGPDLCAEVLKPFGVPALSELDPELYEVVGTAIGRALLDDAKSKRGAKR